MTSDVRRRSAFRMRIRPGCEDAYVDAHAAVWPELLPALKAAGVRNYTNFRDGLDVFGYFEGDDLDAADAHMAGTDVNRRWQEAMAPLIDAEITGVAPPSLTEIFRLD